MIENAWNIEVFWEPTFEWTKTNKQIKAIMHTFLTVGRGARSRTSTVQHAACAHIVSAGVELGTQRTLAAEAFESRSIRTSRAGGWSRETWNKISYKCRNGKGWTAQAPKEAIRIRLRKLFSIAHRTNVKTHRWIFWWGCCYLTCLHHRKRHRHCSLRRRNPVAK